MNEQQERALTAGLKALADATKHARASEHVEQAVLKAAGSAREGVSRSPVSRPFIAAAAMLVLTSISGAWLAHRIDRVPVSPIRPAGFIAIPGASALPPMESGAIVRVALPLTALPQYGLAIVPEAANDSVEADLLVAQDGIPRAIRLAYELRNSRSTP